ncbi:MAG: methionyl-tRNA formyltransferase [Syntrophales bacterium]|nr:methionyl-tRNA formyltransferase [Syntrophales bacterium]
MIKPKILFMGTPGFAVPALSLLVEQNYPLGGVVTQPDRPQGRGRVLQPSPVKTFALAHHLPILQPERVRDDDFLKTFRLLSPDMVVLAAFGQILPNEIIDGPKMGCLNIHPSLLPRYRGAAPINWAIIHGEQKTGVTIMRMAEELDTGDMIMQQETAIGADETFDQLHDRLASLGAELLVKAIEMTVRGTAVRLVQDGSAATCAPMLKKEDGLIRWDRDVDSIVNLIRGLASSPGAYTFLEGKKLKVFGAKGEKTATGEPPGTVARREEASLTVSAGNGYVYLQDVQMESKKRMAVQDFLRGYEVRAGSVLG